MSYNGSGTFQINSSGQPVVTGTVISSTAFNALTADLATGLSTAITKDGQTTTTVRVPFAAGISSTLVTDATSTTTGSIITAGGISTQKALFTGGNITASAAGAIQIIAQSTANSTYPTMYLKANNRSWWTSALDTGTDASLAFGIGATPGTNELMRLTPAGNLGIGSAPLSVLANRTDLTINGASAGAILSLGNAGTRVAYLVSDGTNVGLSNDTATGYLRFLTVGTERARIGSDGSFLVGQTASPGAGSLGVTTAAGVYTASFTAASTGGNYYFLQMLGGTGGTIANNGTITTYAATSDERMKDWTGIVQSDKRQMISDLWLGDFDIYDDFTKTGTPHRGFGVRAQQAYAVLGSQFGLSPPMSETDKWQAPSEPFGFLALWGVKDLYKTVQEQQAIIATLKARLTALENK